MKNNFNSMDDVPSELKEKLAKYFTNVGGDTFAIVGLPPELTGGALARYSRAATGMQLTIINEFLDESGEPSQAKGSELMDRVLNAYGDDSVGELEGAHAGIENVSQLVTKTIEDRRIGGSPIEQSTRYVKYDQKDKNGNWRYLRPREIMKTTLAEEFVFVNDFAFELYSEIVTRLIEHFKKELPEDKFTIEVMRNGKKAQAHKSELNGTDEERAFRNAYSFTVRCAALDVGRCVLPSSTLTHVGVYGNGRFWTNVISELKSGELVEEKKRGEDLEKELAKVIPTFIKRGGVRQHNVERLATMRELARTLFIGIKPESNYVELLPGGEYIDEVVSSSIYPYVNVSLKQIRNYVSGLEYEKKKELLDVYVGRRMTRRDRSGRGIESGYPLTFDLVGGFAEYRDLQRHRMLTQQRQILSTDLGFIMPPEMKIIRMEEKVLELVERMNWLNKGLREKGLVGASQYATLFNNRVRFCLGMNLREFQHLSELRTTPQGHFSYRAMVMEMARQVTRLYPWAERTYGFVDYSDPGNKITRAQEQSRIAGANLRTGIDGERDLV